MNQEILQNSKKGGIDFRGRCYLNIGTTPPLMGAVLFAELYVIITGNSCDYLRFSCSSRLSVDSR